MNRQIKFRAWDGSSFYYPSYGLLASNCDELGNACICQGLSDCSYIERSAVIQQFTGLKDKNGREIYEGDILKLKTYDGWKDSFGRYVFLEVRYHELTASFRMTRGETYRGDSFDYSDKPKEVEVAGNIFESPELLIAPAINLEVHSVHVDSDGGITCYNKEGLDVEYPSIWPERIDNITEFMGKQGITIAR